MSSSVWHLRKIEIKLLCLAMIYLAIGALVLYLWQPMELGFMVWAVVIPGLAFLGISLFWLWIQYQGDPFLLAIVAILSFTSLIVLYRLNTVYAQRQFIWLLIGLLALVLTTIKLTNYKVLADYKYVIAALGVLALILPMFIGVERGGAKSWLDLGFFSLQPSEFVKIMLVIFLASFMAENKLILAKGSKTLLGVSWPSFQVWGPLLGMWGLGLLLLVFQRDLGTALIYFGTFLAMIYLASSRFLYVILGMILFFLGALAAGHLFSHVQMRYITWLNPWSYMHDQGYQIVQSLFALGAGGLIGVGLGAGYPEFIPAIHTDFIFSAITEEMGLLGGVAILLLYLFFIYRGFRISLAAADDFSTMVAGGLTALMGLQAFIIIAGVTKLLPLTGVTLPFVSYGGSSLVANFIIVGMLMNISHESRVKPEPLMEMPMVKA